MVKARITASYRSCRCGNCQAKLQAGKPHLRIFWWDGSPGGRFSIKICSSCLTRLQHDIFYNKVEEVVAHAKATRT